MTWRPPKSAARRAGWSWLRTARAGAQSEPQSDTGEFDEIAKRHKGYLHRVALRMTGKAHAADDLVQETLLRGMRNFRQFRQGTNARTWLVKILTNLFLDECKHSKVVSKAEPDLIAVMGERDPLVRQITDEELWAAVRALEKELREVVELCYLKQMKYRECAKLLNVPIGTVGTRLLRARELLREQLIAKHTGRKA